MEEKNTKKVNDKGFSLVELIIVIAIMGILVGVVGTQVVPYMERSREAKDQQILSSVATAVTSAVALQGESVKEISNKSLTELDNSTDGNPDLAKEIAALLLPESKTTKTGEEAQKYLEDGFVSKKATAHKTIYVSYFPAEGKLYVFLANADSVKKGFTSNSTTPGDDVALYVESN